jgi:Zn-dependent M32 family carboxypeptidase
MMDDVRTVMTTAHEGRHGRYAQNLPAWRHQPAGGDLGGSMQDRQR